jgi:hypothetical protein
VALIVAYIGPLRRVPIGVGGIAVRPRAVHWIGVAVAPPRRTAMGTARRTRRRRRRRTGNPNSSAFASFGVTRAAAAILAVATMAVIVLSMGAILRGQYSTCPEHRSGLPGFRVPGGPGGAPCFIGLRV